MIIDKNLFLQLLTASRIVDPGLLQSKLAEFDASAAEHNLSDSDSTHLAQWLVTHHVLSAYQSEVLLAGHSGPLSFGGYRIVNRLSEGPLSGSFEARHAATGFPVALTFFPGRDSASLEQWKQVEKLSGVVSSIDDPNLTSIYEAVVLPEYRFVASGAATGRPLSQVVPAKSRMAWKDACRIVAMVASGLKALHAKGIVHKAISPRSVWMETKNLTVLRLSVAPDLEFDRPGELTAGESKYDYLAPEVSGTKPQVSAAADFYSLGCLLFRLISGRSVFANENVKEVIAAHRSNKPGTLAKYKIPEQLEQLIFALLAKTPSDRVQDHDSIQQTLRELAGLKDSSAAAPAIPEKLAAARARYRTLIAQNESAGIDVLGSKRVDGAPQISTDDASRSAQPSADSFASLSTDNPQIAGSATALHLNDNTRKKNRWLVPLAIAASLLFLCSLVGGVAWWANGITVANRVDIVDPANEDQNESGQNDGEVADAVNEETSPQNVIPVRIQQDLIADDRTSLWQTPTEGANVDFRYVASGSRIMYIFRPAKLLENPEGQRLLKSVGPRMNSLITNWQSGAGVMLSEIDQLIVSLHSADSRYDLCYVVRLNQPCPTNELVAKWRGTAAVKTAGGNRLYSIDNQSFFPVPSAAADATIEFVYGPTEKVVEVADTGGAYALTGSFQTLSRWTDRDRHFTFLFLRQALVNQEGQWLMSGAMSELNKRLDLLMPDELQGGMISLHIDAAKGGGSYFELVLDQNLDLKSDNLKTKMESEMRTQRDQLTSFASAIPSAIYWDQVRTRFSLMVADFYRNLRWGVEYDRVVANCWLPPNAAHNLVAAAEHVMTFGSGTGGPAAQNTVATTDTPVSLEALLKSKRNLNQTTNPDMIVLLREFRQEIIEDYGELPFPFEIRLIGNDLQRDGITQNQRPGAFRMDDKTVAEILTEIMVRCNPNKEISGPEDANCKLVWAIGDDPESPGQEAILITTRQGASEKQIELPAAFQIPE